MGSIAIIHFNPLELYPPVQNLLHVLSQQKAGSKVYVFTTAGATAGLDPFSTTDKNIIIVRLGKSGQQLPLISRAWNYLRFYLGCLFYFIIKRPLRILYYETISSLPAVLYKRIAPRVEVFIHYHEYTSVAEYAAGMKLTKLFHKLEKKSYPYAKWVSHTNSFRMDLFERDVFPVKVANQHILPNYPPGSWMAAPGKKNEYPVKVVYTGALSMDTMYTRVFTEWIIAQGGKVNWDIYSYNITDDARLFFEDLHCEWVSLKAGVNYDSLPGILQQYDVGVILYKGHIPNYIYNAPNKLFEYYAIGLDVWFPEIMEGALPYITTGHYPRILAVDFNKLNDFSLERAADKTGLQQVQSSYFCEKELVPLVDGLFGQ